MTHRSRRVIHRGRTPLGGRAFYRRSVVYAWRGAVLYYWRRAFWIAAGAAILYDWLAG